MADEAPAAAAPVAPPATPAAPTDGALPPQPVATETKVPVTQADAIAQIEGSEDYAALEAALDGAAAIEAAPEPEAKAAETAPTPAPAAPAVTDGAPPPPATPAPAPAVPDGEDDGMVDPATGEKLPKNIRFHTTDPKRSRFLKLLRSEEGINPIEAARRVGYELPASEQAVAAAPVAPPASAQTIEESLKPQRDEIAALKEQKKAARTAYEFDKVDEIGDQILEKTLALDRKQSELEQQASYAEEYNVGYQSALGQAFEKYPDTGKRGTPQFEALMRERTYLEATEPGFFDNPDYPIVLLTRLEKSRPDLFKQATAAAPLPAPPAPAAVTPPPNAAPVLPARPVGQVVAGAETATQPLTKQDTVKAIDEMTDPEEIEKLANLVGTQGTGRTVRR